MEQGTESSLNLLMLFAGGLIAGIIWLVQLYIYPNFKKIDEKEWISFHNFHVKTISLIVIPIMVAEGLLLLGAMFYLEKDIFLWAIFSTTAIAWGSTFLIQVPLHKKLSQQHNSSSINKLIRSNWIRTIAWTAKGGLLLTMTLAI